ncbi:MAG: cysteine methyltransferase [Chloroflexales bacterium]|nr:cysteine methyltransferase [Chloroflexales bacterium]
METYESIYAVVRRIPYGRVSSYGRVALLAGRPGAARLVGYALHALRPGAGDEVPWWRVVNHSGVITNGYEPALQQARLVAEGVAVDDVGRVDLRRYLWDGEEGPAAYFTGSACPSSSG